MGQCAHLVRTHAPCFRPSDLSTNVGLKLVNAQVPHSEGEEDSFDPCILPSRDLSWDADPHRGHGLGRPPGPDEVQEEIDHRRPQASMEASIQYS